MAAFKDSTGAAYLPTVTDGGAVPVAVVDEADGDLAAEDGAEGLLLKIYRELREQRRVLCEMSGQLFTENLE